MSLRNILGSRTIVVDQELGTEISAPGDEERLKTPTGLVDEPSRADIGVDRRRKRGLGKKKEEKPTVRAFFAGRSGAVALVALHYTDVSKGMKDVPEKTKKNGSKAGRDEQPLSSFPGFLTAQNAWFRSIDSSGSSVTSFVSVPNLRLRMPPKPSAHVVLSRTVTAGTIFRPQRIQNAWAYFGVVTAAGLRNRKTDGASIVPDALTILGTRPEG
ncbi:hypothetical protein B0H19DRAFT_1329187 [Mycena capillaripes]|nr:hypothetical protein B0H19DRAFT_1329187 [Mycena capillaripes]